jgi:hypothetical protein
MLEVGTFSRVLDGKSADVPLSVDIQLGVLVEILGFDDVAAPEFDIEGTVSRKYLTFMAQAPIRLAVDAAVLARGQDRVGGRRAPCSW